MSEATITAPVILERTPAPPVETWAELVPKIAALEEAFRQEQLEAFLEMEPDIAGIEVKPFTPRMFLELTLAENAFLHPGKAITSADIAALVWRISSAFDRKNEKQRAAFAAQILNRNVDELISGIHEYLTRAFAAAPLGRKSGGKSISVWPSALVFRIGEKFGWSQEYVLDRPLRLLYQYLNRILESEDPDYHQICPAAAEMKAQWLAKINAANLSPL